MANYNVDIAVAVRNLNQLQRFKRELTSLQRAVDDFNDKGLEAGSKAEENALKKIARKKRDINNKIIQDLATSNLKSLEALAKKELELENKVFKDKLQSIKDLQKAEEEANREQIKNDDREFKNKLDARKRFDKKVEASLKMAFKGIEKVSKGAQKLDDMQTKREIENDNIVFKTKLDKYNQETRVILQDMRRRHAFELKLHDEKLRKQLRATEAANRKAAAGTGGSATGTTGIGRAKRVNAALTAGAFPLLFGGGPGTAIGGALGGALTGQLFGGLTVVGQVLGGAVDSFVAKTSQLGQALNPLTADLEALIAATGNVNSNTSLLIKELEAADLSAAALMVATEELAVLVGRDGVQALDEFGSDTVALGNEFNRAMTIMASGVAMVVNAAGILKGVAQALERITLRQQIGRLINSNTKTGERLRSTLTPNGPGQLSRFRGSRITEDTFEMMRTINQEGQGRVNQTARNLALDKDANAIAKAEFELKKTGLDFTSKEFVNEKKRIALMEFNQDMERINLTLANDLLTTKDTTLSKEKARNAAEEARIKLNTVILEIDQRAAKALDAKTKKEETASKKLENNAAKLARDAKKLSDERARQVDQAMSLESQFSLELKNRQAVSQLEVDKNNINAEYEQRVKRLAKIGDETLTADAQALAIQIRNSKLAEAEANARERSAKAANALKDSQADFEMQLATLRANAPGQFGGLFGGSERTAFLGGLDIQTQFEKANREIQVMRDKVAAGTAQQSEVDNLIAARDQYKFYQEQVLEATVAQEQFAEALAVTQPVTDSLFDSLMAVAEGTKSAEQAFADFLRSIASMLMDAAKQMIATYIAIGVAKAFAGMGSSASSPAPDIQTGEGFGLGPQIMVGGMRTAASGKGALMNQPYLVGEKGPELFVPKGNGTIVPNHQVSGGSNIVVNVDASGSSVEGDAQQSKALGQAIGAAVQAEIVKQKMPGGLLN